MQASHHDLCIAIRRALVLACEALAEIHDETPIGLYYSLIDLEIERVGNLAISDRYHEQQELNKLESKYYERDTIKRGLSRM